MPILQASLGLYVAYGVSLAASTDTQLLHSSRGGVSLVYPGLQGLDALGGLHMLLSPAQRPCTPTVRLEGPEGV